MIVAHRDAPISHAATRIGCRNLVERLFRLFILERVQPGDSVIELLLRGRRAGNNEIHAPEFFRRFVTMIAVLGLNDDRTENERDREQEGTFHGAGPFRGRRNGLTKPEQLETVRA